VRVHSVHAVNADRVPTPPGKSWIFFLKIPEPGSPGKALWSWKVLEIED